MARSRFIGIDIGTTALKAVLVDGSGVLLGEHVAPYPIARPETGHAEQDPADWMAAVLAALDTFARGDDPAAVAAIGLTSQVNTHVFVDRSGEPLLPAFLWQDQRTATDAAALEGRVTPEQKMRWLGALIPIDASHALARIAHVARVRPDVLAQTAHVLLPKDYCAMRLTGAVGSDPISAVGLVGRDGYATELLDLVPGSAALLPSLHPAHHVAGIVRDGLPFAGVPVIAGTMDAWAGMFGVGVVAEGDAMNQCGTSEIPGIVASRVAATPGIIVFPPYDGITLHAAPTQSGGASLAWAARLLGRDTAAAVALAAEAAPSDAVPLFLPHLEGERAPLWDTATRGVFARLDSRAGPPELARSVLEGVALSVRLAFDALAASAGTQPATINIGGGGSRADLWCQIRADALGIPLRRVATPHAAALGAAILARLGVGAATSLATAVRDGVQFDRTFVPDATLAPYYDDKFGRYRALYDALRPFNAAYG